MAPFEALYGCRFRSPIGWFEVRKAGLIGLDFVFKAMEKVLLIHERLKSARSHKKSYTDEGEERSSLKWVIGYS